MRLSIYLLAIIFGILFSCSPPHQEEEEHWGYTGESGPEHWEELSAGSDCDGDLQSPIDLDTSNIRIDTTLLEESVVHAGAITHVNAVTNNGHTIRYDFESEENYIEKFGKRFILRQFHFHSPSEHTVNGVRFPLELHMVHHHAESNEYVVISNLIARGKPSQALSFLEDYLPLQPNESREINKEYDFTFEYVSNQGRSYYMYDGSLTTPPCHETVHWLILSEPRHASEEQIEILASQMPVNNFRDEQEVNNREIIQRTFFLPED